MPHKARFKGVTSLKKDTLMKLCYSVTKIHAHTLSTTIQAMLPSELAEKVPKLME
jgi:hypothetical protein